MIRNNDLVKIGIRKLPISSFYLPSSWLKTVTSAYYQLVYSNGSILGDSLDHGIAGKFSFYLSQLAIPAIGLGAAYNVKENYIQGIFSMGMSF